jgi:hypothetical protein
LSALTGDSGADVEAVVREAVMAAIEAVTERDEVALTGERFDRTLRSVRPSLSE